MPRTIAIAPGDGIGPEVVGATLDVLERMSLGLQFVEPLAGEAAVAQGLPPVPDQAKSDFDAADATLFGAASGVSGRIAGYLRWGQQTYANVRPARWTPGCRSPLARPQGIDLVILRENLEDSYVRLEGDLADLAPLKLTSPLTGCGPHEMGEGVYAIKAITRRGSERIGRDAFELARRRKAEGRPGRVTASSKYNMLPRTDGLFIEVVREVAQEYPDIEFETFIVDDMAHRLIIEPHRLDVVVLPNLYGDVLSDAAAALVGGLGLAPSGCYGERHAYFESAHGSAPDIAGRGIANPTATLLSAAMMLEHLDLADAGAALRTAVDRVYATGRDLTPDQGGSRSTREFADAVVAALP